MGEDEEVRPDLLPLAGDGEVAGGAPGLVQGRQHGYSSGRSSRGASHPSI